METRDIYWYIWQHHLLRIMMEINKLEKIAASHSIRNAHLGVGSGFGKARTRTVMEQSNVAYGDTEGMTFETGHPINATRFFAGAGRSFRL
jgi:hypothetical protein